MAHPLPAPVGAAPQPCDAPAEERPRPACRSNRREGGDRRLAHGGRGHLNPGAESLRRAGGTASPAVKPPLPRARRALEARPWSQRPDRLAGGRPVSDEAVLSLAKDAGLLADWEDAAGEAKTVTPESLRAILSAMGLPAGSQAEAEDSRRQLAEISAAAPGLI